MPVQKLQGFLRDLKLSKQQELIGRQILKEIRARVGFLAEVGLEYLSLGRATGTLSGGEAQRIRLATQIGSGLVGSHISWMSRVSGFTREIMTSFWGH